MIAEPVLRVGRVLLRRFQIPGQRVEIALQQSAAAVEIHVAEIDLGLGEVLVGGFTVPLDGFDIVARQPILALSVFDAEQILRRRIAAIGRGHGGGERSGERSRVARIRRRHDDRRRLQLRDRRIDSRRRNGGRPKRGRRRRRTIEKDTDAGERHERRDAAAVDHGAQFRRQAGNVRQPFDHRASRRRDLDRIGRRLDQPRVIVQDFRRIEPHRGGAERIAEGARRSKALVRFFRQRTHDGGLDFRSRGQARARSGGQGAR